MLKIVWPENDRAEHVHRFTHFTRKRQSDRALISCSHNPHERGMTVRKPIDAQQSAALLAGRNPFRRS